MEVYIYTNEGWMNQDDVLTPITGKVLLEMYNNKEVRDVRFFLKQSQFSKNTYPGTGKEP